jgi:5S rRNA maturation endonuclease (ribonuclease M5)
MNTATANILSRLKKVKQRQGGWIALCPAHADKQPSLSISEAEDGKVLLHCHAGCQTEDILSAIGLTISDLFPTGANAAKPAADKRVVKTYDYTDEQGNLLFQVCRTEPKGFFQRRPDGKGGWINGLGDVTPTLYHLPPLKKAIKAGTKVFIAEGEKDVEALERLGLFATTNPMGAGKWRDAYSSELKGAKCVILPDNDEVGREHAQQVAKSLYGIAESIKILELTSLPVKGDVSDWIMAGGTKEELLKLADNAEEYRPQPDTSGITLFTAQEIAAATFNDPEYIIDGFLPTGITLLAGKPKVGKSWLALDFATGIAAGKSVCGIKCAQANTLYLSLEDTQRRLQRRLMQGSFIVTQNCLMATQWRKLDEGGLDDLKQTIIERNIKLVIIDTLQKIRPKGNSKLYESDYAAIGDLKAMLDALNVSAIIVHHTRKTGSDDPIEEVSGTTGLTGAVDTIMVLKRGRGEADGTLNITGRDIEDTELALNFEGCRWRVLGSAAEYAVSKEKRELLGAMQQLGGITDPKTLAVMLGKTETSVRMALARAVAEGLITREGRGKYRYTPNVIQNIIPFVVEGDKNEACYVCGGRDFWTSKSGKRICRICHPPAPGAEAIEE